MLCKICEREKPVSRYTHPRIRVCTECEELLGYDKNKLGNQVGLRVDEKLNGRLKTIVQQELPKALLEVITEKHNEIDVKIWVS